VMIASRAASACWHSGPCTRTKQGEQV
jgi:hypothetical protein